MNWTFEQNMFFHLRFASCVTARGVALRMHVIFRLVTGGGNIFYCTFRKDLIRFFNAI